MRIVSWNIAGSSKVGFDKAFDYKKEDPDYFIRQLTDMNADVICLQESHTNEQRSLAAVIAQGLGGYHIFDSPLSPSHINPDYQLAIAMLGRKAFDNFELYTYPQPTFELRFPDGRIAQKHRKGLQIARYQGISISNTHWLSMLTFGHSYASGEGAAYAAELVAVMLEHLPEPSIICGDFNVGEFGFDHALVPLVERLHFQSALPDKSTFHLPGRIMPHDTNAPDRIYVPSSGFRVLQAGVVSTETDHYICWVDVESLEKIT